MGFYLNDKYISDNYLKYKLISSNKTSLEGNVNINSNEEILLNKLDIKIDSFTLSEVLDSIMDSIDNKNIDTYSMIMTFDRAHVLALFYLIHLNRITPTELRQVLYSTSYKSRSELLLSLLKENEKDNNTEIDIFAPLKAVASKMSNYKNGGELASLGKTSKMIINELQSIKAISGKQQLNYGSYFYRKYPTSSKDIYHYCDIWSPYSSTLVNDTFSKRLFQYTGDDISSVLEELKPYAVNADKLASSWSNWFATLMNRWFLGEEYMKQLDKEFQEYRVFDGFHMWWSNNDIYNNWNNRMVCIEIDPIIYDVYSNISAYCANQDFKNRLKPKTKLSVLPSTNLLKTKINNCIKSSYRTSFNAAIWGPSDERDQNEAVTYYDDGPEYNIYNYYTCLDSFIKGNSSYLTKSMSKVHDRESVIEAMATRTPVEIELTHSVDITPETAGEKKMFNIIKCLISSNSADLDNRYFVESLLEHTDEIDISRKVKEELDALLMENPTDGSGIWILENIVKRFKRMLEILSGLDNSSLLAAKYQNAFYSILEMDMLIGDISNNKADIVNFGTTPIYNKIIDIANTITKKLESEFMRQIDRTLIIKYNTKVIDIALAALATLRNTETESRYIIAYEYAYSIVKKYLYYLKDTDTENPLTIYDSFKLILDGSNHSDEWLYKYYMIMYFLRHSAMSMKEISNLMYTCPAFNSLLSEDTTATNQSLEAIEKYIDSAKKHYCTVAYEQIIALYSWNLLHHSVFRDDYLYSPSTYYSLISSVYDSDTFPTPTACEHMKEKSLISIGDKK